MKNNKVYLTSNKKVFMFKKEINNNLLALAKGLYKFEHGDSPVILGGNTWLSYCTIEDPDEEEIWVTSEVHLIKIYPILRDYIRSKLTPQLLFQIKKELNVT